MENFEFMQEKIRNSMYRLNAEFKSKLNDNITVTYLEDTIKCLHDYWNTFFYNHNKIFYKVTRANDIHNSYYFRDDIYDEVSEYFIDLESELQELLAARGGKKIVLSNSIYEDEVDIVTSSSDLKNTLCSKEYNILAENKGSLDSSTSKTQQRSCEPSKCISPECNSQNMFLDKFNNLLVCQAYPELLRYYKLAHKYTYLEEAKVSISSICALFFGRICFEIRDKPKLLYKCRHLKRNIIMVRKTYIHSGTWLMGKVKQKYVFI